ncbi:Uncharacterized protein PIL02S_01984 [Paenibacillus illinoisensis]|uniref:HEAT repeat domain-containing protein n=1 Tax=Paenibacillus illinoisensis TaxID=59845 RepID=A0A2W0CCP4_9BACL|nr:Uncharacterized protein PIL02S_01984 [Paenibacillus illinoisensis]
MIISAEEFVRLRESETQSEYLRAAWEKATLEVWVEVVEKYPDMRFWVAQNKTIPYEIMEILSDDQSERVRGMIASKNRLPEHLQMKMAKDLDSSVRERIAYNKKTSAVVLQLLLHDEDESIREKARNRLTSLCA